jgi:hypothetical protein
MRYRLRREALSPRLPVWLNWALDMKSISILALLLCTTAAQAEPLSGRYVANVAALANAAMINCDEEQEFYERVVHWAVSKHHVAIDHELERKLLSEETVRFQEVSKDNNDIIRRCEVIINFVENALTK